MSLPISLERQAAQPVLPIADTATNFRDNRQQQPGGYVYRGELLETIDHRSYRPRENLQISPENRRAISAYHKITDEPSRPGQILDGYI